MNIPSDTKHSSQVWRNTLLFVKIKKKSYMAWMKLVNIQNAVMEWGSSFFWDSLYSYSNNWYYIQGVICASQTSGDCILLIDNKIYPVYIWYKFCLSVS